MESSGECDSVAGTDNDPIHSSLTNPLVLHQIFAYLPTSHLLTACSLVNRFWLMRARTFVRDHRETWLTIRSGQAKGPGSICEACLTLQALADSLFVMEVIPLNSLSFAFPSRWSHRAERYVVCDNSNIENSENILKIKLKHCAIDMSGDTSRFCASYKLLQDLLRNNSENLKTLKFDGMSPDFAKLLKYWVPKLPRLELLVIDEGVNPKCKDFFGKIIKNAPSLREIDLGGSCRWHPLSVIPEEPTYYKLLSNFTVRMDTDDSKRRCLIAGVAGPALKVLSAHYHIRNHGPLFWNYCTVLQQLISSSRDRLEEIDFYFQSRITRLFTCLQWPVMSKLGLLDIRTRGDHSDQALLSIVMGLLNYDGMFPALKEVHLRAGPRQGIGIWELGDEEEGNPQVNMPPMANTCLTVSKLQLHMKLDEPSLLRIATTFPAVTHLCLYILHGNVPPFSQIFKLWPHLEDLDLRGESLHLCPNRDAEFCGITSEEMDTYYGKDEQFLTALQVVPVRPCLSTLQSLRSLSTDRFLPRGLAAVDELANPNEVFLSKVTNLLVFQRLPLLKVNIRFDCSDDSVASEEPETVRHVMVMESSSSSSSDTSDEGGD